MTVVVDTAGLPAEARADALRDAFSAEAPQQVDFARATSHRYRVELVDLVPDVRLRHTTGVPLHVRRTERHVRMEAPEYVSFGLERQGTSLLTTGVTTRPASHLHLDCVDTTRPYALEQHDPTRRDDLVLANREVGLPVEVVRAAAPRIRASPVYPLFHHHVLGLYEATKGVDDATRRLVGQATVALARALLLTAAGHGQAREALADTLELRVRDHVDRHLHEGDLTVERLAALHHVSVRHLYDVWARAGHEQTPAEWIATRRVERARDLLAADGPGRPTVAEVARRCGFADASHFGRRFRQAYGTSPGVWRRERRA